MISRNSSRFVFFFRQPYSMSLKLSCFHLFSYFITSLFVRQLNQRFLNCPFALYTGTKKPVKRKKFEEFISKKTVIWPQFLLRNRD